MSSGLCPKLIIVLFFLALLLGGDFFTGTVLAAALTKLVLRFADLSSDKKKANTLRAEAMLIMTSTIRVGQSKFTSAPIDEDSNERILNCIQTLSELEVKPVVHDIFLNDTKAAYSKMVAAQEVNICYNRSFQSLTISTEKGGGEAGARGAEARCGAG